MSSNKQLAKYYNTLYKTGEKKYYTKLRLKKGGGLPIEEREVLGAASWKGKTVLDVGCGTGLLAHEIAKRGAREVVGIDFSKEGVEIAREKYRAKNLEYRVEDLRDHRGSYDIVVSLGTLEHMDDPLRALQRMKKLLKPGGLLILTCPNWTNPRGYILQTLYFLFDAPITRADLHYLTPIEFMAWAKKLGMKLQWKTFYREWAHGDVLLGDFKKRLPNVLRDAKLPRDEKRIKAFIEWIKTHIVALDHSSPWSGALGLYILKK